MSQMERKMKEKEQRFFMNSDKLSVEEKIEFYKPDVEMLAVYVPWLEQQQGKMTAQIYAGDDIEKNSVTFPVYDSTLISFVKEAQKSSLIDRNYVYVYSRNRIRTAEDEKRFIERATIREMGDLWGILSKYILKGMTKGMIWSEGVKNGVYLALLQKMQELIAFWDKEKKD